jgi:translation initiation factor IF-3
VAVPRRFDRRPPERDTTRINDRIRVPEVRLIDDEGNQIGVLTTADALAFAQERELDLVEVAPEARPPVCRVLDYSKYKYEQAQKQKAARKHQQQITIREIKFRPKIAQHDYDTKKNHVERFLRHKDKVKVTIMFRGREVTHPERGTAILDRLAEELAEFGVIEQHPTQEGRNMTMMMAPSKAVLAGRVDNGEHAAVAAAAASDGAGADAAPAQEPAPAPAQEPAPAPAQAPAAAQEPASAAEPAPEDEPASSDGEGAGAPAAGEEESHGAAPEAGAPPPASAAPADATPDAAEEPAAASSNGEVAIDADGKAKPVRKPAKRRAKAAAPADGADAADADA